MDSETICSICLQILGRERTVTVKKRKLTALIKKSKQKNDDKWKIWISQPETTFHVGCRKRYGISSAKGQSTSAIAPPSLSNVPSTSEVFTFHSCVSSGNSTSLSEPKSEFEFDKSCFICGKKWNPKIERGCIVQQNSIKDRIISIAKEREDNLGSLIIARLQKSETLTQLEARYHVRCYKNFIAPHYKKRQPVKINQIELILQKVYNYIETSTEIKFQLSTLKPMLRIPNEDENQNDEEEFIETRTFLRHLKKKYGDDIFIFKQWGKETVIYYKLHDIAKICSDWYCNKEGVSEVAKKSIITMCAEILQDEVKKVHYDTTVYPKPNEFLDTIVLDVPPLLTTFLNKLMLSDCNIVPDKYSLIPKIDNIAHSIISALRPKSFMSCLQLAVGIYIYRKTKSKLVIDLLNKLGVCSSYHNIKLHEASSIMNPETTKITDVFVQYVFDNTEHNISTLDGKGGQTCKNPSLRPSQDLLDDDNENDCENEIEDLESCSDESIKLQLQEESIEEFTNESLRSSEEAMKIDHENY